MGTKQVTFFHDFLHLSTESHSLSNTFSFYMSFSDANSIFCLQLPAKFILLDNHIIMSQNKQQTRSFQHSVVIVCPELCDRLTFAAVSIIINTYFHYIKMLLLCLPTIICTCARMYIHARLHSHRRSLTQI